MLLLSIHINRDFSPPPGCSAMNHGYFMGFVLGSESVSEGHPDEVGGHISEAIFFSYLAQDPNSRVACETLIKNNTVIVAGEITSKGTPNIEEVIRNTVNEIGYIQDDLGFIGSNCEFQNLISAHSPEIAHGVIEGEGEDLDQGAGDQGLMFGYACSETPVLMPAPINLSHELVLKQSEVRKRGELSWLRPDAKSQVRVVYKDERKTVEYVSAIVLSTQHDEEISQEEIKAKVREKIINPIIPTEWIKEETKIYINPTGKFVIGGLVGDCGLTGRKIIVESFGGMERYGGGEFLGKD
jgi:S-adenosylmethionine synthetase